VLLEPRRLAGVFHLTSIKSQQSDFSYALPP
jgi:hypothetical protein